MQCQLMKGASHARLLTATEYVGKHQYIYYYLQYKIHMQCSV